MCKGYLGILPPSIKIALPEVSLQFNVFLLIKSFRRFNVFLYWPSLWSLGLNFDYDGGPIIENGGPIVYIYVMYNWFCIGNY